MNKCPLCAAGYRDSHAVDGGGKSVIYSCGTYTHPFMGTVQDKDCRIRQLEATVTRLQAEQLIAKGVVTIIAPKQAADAAKVCRKFSCAEELERQAAEAEEG